MKDYTKGKKYWNWFFTGRKWTSNLWLYLIVAFAILVISDTFFREDNFISPFWKTFTLLFMVAIVTITFLQPYFIYKGLRRLEGRD